MSKSRGLTVAALVVAAVALPAGGEGQQLTSGTVLMVTFAGPENCGGPTPVGGDASRRCLMKPVRARIIIERVDKEQRSVVVRTRRDGRGVAVLDAGEYLVRPRPRPRRPREATPDARRITIAGGERRDLIFDYVPLFRPS